MPVRPRKVATATAPRPRTPVDQQLDDMADALGVGPRALAAKAKRRKALLAIKRPLTDDEQDELDALIIERQVDRRQAKQFGALVEAAKAEWAERSAVDPEWVATWEKQAEESRRRYGSRTTAEDAHYVHVITSSKGARRIERQAERGYQVALDIEARRAERARQAEQPVAPASAMPAAPTPRAEPPHPVPEPVEPGPPRRRRIKYGVVAQYDAYGDRVL